MQNPSQVSKHLGFAGLVDTLVVAAETVQRPVAQRILDTACSQYSELLESDYKWRLAAI
jgi:hypothetical protein